MTSKLNVERPDYVLKPQELDAAEDTVSRMVATTPRLKIENNKVSIDHPDALIGELLMMGAFGTGDPDFMHGMLRQLANAAGSRGQPPNETDLNFISRLLRISSREITSSACWQRRLPPFIWQLCDLLMTL